MKFILNILLILISIQLIAQVEICDNGIDDDSDGLIDLNDIADCSCMMDPSSIIPNPSFEGYIDCPVTLNQMDSVNFWQSASDGTTDYFNCANYTSGISVLSAISIPQLPPPDGSAYVGMYTVHAGQWKEYASVCLFEPMLPGITYHMEFYVAGGFDPGKVEETNINIGLFGTSDCNDIPFAGNGCPNATTGLTLLATKGVVLSTDGAWQLVGIDFTPSTCINAIAIGTDCSIPFPLPLPKSYFYLDNLSLSISNKIVSDNIGPTANVCGENQTLSISTNSIPVAIQWHKDGIAIIGATDSSYVVPAGQFGNFQAVLFYDTSYSCTATCLILDDYYIDSIPITFDLNTTSACPETGNGIIEVNNIGGGTPPYLYQIDNSALSSDTIYDLLFTGIYSITVEDSNSCRKTQTVLIEELSSCSKDIFIPNAFSPNDDGINDNFIIRSEVVANASLSIYNRWGAVVYATLDPINDFWDGLINGKIANKGVYVYRLNGTYIDGSPIDLKGNIMLVR